MIESSETVSFEVLNGWDFVALDSHVRITSGMSPSLLRFGVGGTPYFKVQQLGVSEKYLNRGDTPYLAIDSPQVPAGSVVFAKRGAAIRLNKVRIFVEPSYMDTNLMALTPVGEFTSEYLFYALNFVGLWGIADITSVPQINNKHIKPLRLPLPSGPEQRMVVEALSDADELIASLERLIAKKRDIKQGAMQQLLTGKTRLPGFKGEWVRCNVGSLGTFLKGHGIKRNDVRASGVACIRYGELYTRYSGYVDIPSSYVDGAVASTALPIVAGDLLFAGSGETAAEIGMCVAYIGSCPAVVGGDIIVLRSRSQDPVFLSSLMNSPDVADQKSRMGQGDAVVHISSSALASIEVNLPELQEQEAIARVIIDMDADINTLQERLAKTESIKQGMMQELLTGRNRLMPQETR